jgi:hypothetical protein
VSLAALCGAVPGWWFARRLGANEVRYE